MIFTGMGFCVNLQYAVVKVIVGSKGILYPWNITTNDTMTDDMTKFPMKFQALPFRQSQLFCGGLFQVQVLRRAFQALPLCFPHCQ